MPSIHRIQIPGELTDLIPLFGLVGPVNEWWISDTLLPVSIVDSQVSLNAVVTPLLYTVTQSEGEIGTPAANTRLVNTGQLNANEYAFKLSIHAAETNTYRIRIRNAADAGDIWSVVVGVPANDFHLFEVTWTLAQNERLVVENIGASAGAVYQARVWYTTI